MSADADEFFVLSKPTRGIGGKAADTKAQASICIDSSSDEDGDATDLLLRGPPTNGVKRKALPTPSHGPPKQKKKKEHEGPCDLSDIIDLDTSKTAPVRSASATLRSFQRDLEERQKAQSLLADCRREKRAREREEQERKEKLLKRLKNETPTFVNASELFTPGRDPNGGFDPYDDSVIGLSSDGSEYGSLSRNRKPELVEVDPQLESAAKRLAEVNSSGKTESTSA